MCYFSSFLFLQSVSSNLQEIFTAYLSSDLYLSGNLWALPLYVLAATTSVYSLRPRERKSCSFLISMFFESVISLAAQLLEQRVSCTFHMAHSLPTPSEQKKKCCRLLYIRVGGCHVAISQFSVKMLCNCTIVIVKDFCSKNKMTNVNWQWKMTNVNVHNR